jgi:hypothetical protein
MLLQTHMRPSVAELRAARSLHRWLRRTALAALPMVGLSACAGDNCDYTSNHTSTVLLSSDAGWAAGSALSLAECQRNCPTGSPCITFQWDSCAVSADGGVLTCTGSELICGTSPCGRLPEGLRSPGVEAQDSLIAAELAAAAYLEGASIFAFEALERELTAHGAPCELVQRARSAQEDEQRHHASMSRLARRRGARIPAVEVDPAPIRTLLELARENAVEGCVRETYGAAVAAFQGAWARDAAVRRALRSIAADEAEHASLGWAVDAWARSRLSRADRAEIDDQRAQALSALRKEIGRPIAPETMSVIGMPGPAAAAALVEPLSPLWSS